MRKLLLLLGLLSLAIVGIASGSAIIVSHDASSITVKFDGYACGQTHVFTDDTGQSVTGVTDACPVADIKIGEQNVLSGADNGNGNLLVSQSAVLSQQATIKSLSFYVV